MREGQRVTVDVVNDTDVPEYVHWHGLFVPSEVDGAEEEGTPPVPPHGRRRYQFVAKPAGSRWYHSHTAAMMDLHRGSYTGQFGFLMIDSANDPGLYDQEVFLALREWEYSDHDGSGRNGGGSQRPDARKTRHSRPASQRSRSQRSSLLDQRQNARRGGTPPREVGSAHPDAPAQRQRFANSSHRFFGHHFQVIALDGNPVPAPQPVNVIEIAPGERVDAIVEMNLPGVWILGEPRDAARQAPWASWWNTPRLIHLHDRIHAVTGGDLNHADRLRRRHGIPSSAIT